mmetsp:Transcript_2701/g.8104  ORF Transcript_2701/g.8104 Transcript_2701/m.8104 type:complete len:226 (-) Transcript_2701:442-1119(-)
MIAFAWPANSVTLRRMSAQSCFTVRMCTQGVQSLAASSNLSSASRRCRRTTSSWVWMRETPSLKAVVVAEASSVTEVSSSWSCLTVCSNLSCTRRCLTCSRTPPSWSCLPAAAVCRNSCTSRSAPSRSRSAASQTSRLSRSSCCRVFDLRRPSSPPSRNFFAASTVLSTFSLRSDRSKWPSGIVLLRTSVGTDGECDPTRVTHAFARDRPACISPSRRAYASRSD